MRNTLLVLAGVAIVLAAVLIARACHLRRVESNEVEAIVDTCSVAAGEGAYGGVVGPGVYGPLECLAEPRSPGCVSNYSADRPRFLDPTVVSLTPRHGYKRAFTPGDSVRNARTSRGITAFCYSAVPATLGWTGRYSFGTDGQGTVCYDPTGAELCSAGEPAGSAMRPVSECRVFQCGDQGRRSPFGVWGRKE